MEKGGSGVREAAAQVSKRSRGLKIKKRRQKGKFLSAVLVYKSKIKFIKEVKNILLTSKQRAKLRGMANIIDAIIRIGKEGITERVLKQIDEALTARELIKIALEKNCDKNPKEAIAYICEKLNAEPVQVIGRKIVIYRMSEENPRIQI